QYLVLHTLEFTSDRKRMGVLVTPIDDEFSEKSQGQIFLLMKGSDDTIFARARGRRQEIANFQDAVEIYSREGLRTLVVAYRKVRFFCWNVISVTVVIKVEIEEYQKWNTALA